MKRRITRENTTNTKETFNTGDIVRKRELSNVKCVAIVYDVKYLFIELPLHLIERRETLEFFFSATTKNAIKR